MLEDYYKPFEDFEKSIYKKGITNNIYFSKNKKQSNKQKTNKQISKRRD